MRIHKKMNKKTIEVQRSFSSAKRELNEPKDKTRYRKAAARIRKDAEEFDFNLTIGG